MEALRVTSLTPVGPLYRVLGMWNPRIWRADCTRAFYLRDVSIPGFWYPQEILEPIPHRYQGTTVSWYSDT